MRRIALAPALLAIFFGCTLTVSGVVEGVSGEEVVLSVQEDWSRPPGSPSGSSVSPGQIIGEGAADATGAFSFLCSPTNIETDLQLMAVWDEDGNAACTDGERWRTLDLGPGLGDRGESHIEPPEEAEPFVCPRRL